MNLKIALIGLLICTYTASQAQSDIGVIWSEQYNEDGYYKILSENNGDVILLRKENSIRDNRRGDIELLKFDSDLALLEAVEVRDLEESHYANLGTINSPEGIAHLYFQTTKRGDQIISTQLFSHEDLRKKDIIDLAKFKIKSSSKQRVLELSEIEQYYPLDYMLSRDKSKLAIFYTQEKVGKKKETYYQYAVIDLNRQFDLLHQGFFYSDDRSNKYKISDIDLADDGTLNYILKSFVNSSSKEHINKKTAYSYELHHLTGDSTEYIYDIKTKGNFIDRLKVGGGKDGSVYIGGFIRKQPFGAITENYFLNLDPMGNKINESRDRYSERQIAEMQGKKDDQLDDNFKVLDVIVTDEIVYITKQYIRKNVNSFNNGYTGRAQFGSTNFNGRDVSWDFDEFVVEGYGVHSGELQWITTNVRNQEDHYEYPRSFITGSSHVVDGDLLLVYNERVSNIERMRKGEKIKRSDIPGDNTEPYFARISQDGDINYRSIRGENRFHIPNSGVLITEDKMILVGSKDNYSRFRIGKAGIDVIKF